MSGPPFMKLGDLDGTHGWVRTKGFVNWIEDVASHQPYQRVALGDDTVSEPVICTVWTEDVELEEGVGYYLGGVDDTYEKREEIQLKLYEKSWADEFWRRE
ncbi:hypothetical protein [Haloarcula laminariae]|uniref:hypothetical protein n=1 Tax=Haloarcula laminariae TaxID=2961577 RepID=UPI0021C857B5|nr:hypothetical protein [Halomicroarcula laminariae]